jgi:hypothetical protein
MRLEESRSLRTVVAGTRTGRKMLELADDPEVVALGQASRHCRVYPLSLEVALMIARLAYYGRSPA